MGNVGWDRTVPDELPEIAKPLLPPARPGRKAMGSADTSTA